MKERARGVSAQLNSSSNSAITQPVGQQRSNVRRTQQIKALHLQFEDLKKKIKDVESKNEKIIQNIHKQYDFKKKPQTMEYMVDNPPIVYYEQQPDKSQVSADNQSNQSDQSECEFKVQRPPIKKNSNIKKNIHSAFHQSIEYRKTENTPQERDQIDNVSSKGTNPLFRPPLPNNQFALSAGSQFSVQTVPPPQQPFQISQFNGLNPYQVSVQFPPYNPTVPNMSLSQVGSYYGQSQVNIQLQQNLRRQKEKIKLLEQKLDERQEESAAYKKLQKRYGTMAKTYEQAIEGCIQQFMQEYMKKSMHDIQKAVKKIEMKLKRMHLKLKDKEQDFISKRNIEEHRLRRSHSRSKRDSSPKQTNYNSLSSAPKIPSRKAMASQPSSTLNVDSASKSKQSEHSKSSQQFEVIASQYEEMIKVKNKDLQLMEQKLKSKQKQLIEMTTKCSKLQSKLSDYAEIPKAPKSRRNSERDENLLANLDFDSQKEAQLKTLTKKIAQIEDQLKLKTGQLREKDIGADKLSKKIIELESKNKRLDTQITKLRQQSKKNQVSSKTQSELLMRMKKIEGELQVKEKQVNVIRDKCNKAQSQKIEKQCENMTLMNKLKKIESLINVKEEKIQELEKIIQSNTGVQIGDLLEKSMYLQKFDQNQIHLIQEQKQKLQEQLIRQREQIFSLRKNNQAYEIRCSELLSFSEGMKKEQEALLIQNESMRINMKALEFEKYNKSEVKSPLQKLLDEGDCISEGEDEHAIREELEEMRIKYEQSQRALKAQKHQSLEYNTKVIKLNSELSYYRELLSERQDKYEKIRKEFEEGRVQANVLNQALQEKEAELQVERKVNNEKIKEIQSQWLEFEQEMRHKEDNNLDDSHNVSDLRASRNFSEESFVNYRNTFNSVNAQNEHLGQKLKEAEKIIEIQREMEDKIMNEYRSNIEKIKTELREKCKLNEQQAQEVENLKRRVRVLEQTEARLKQMAKNNNEEEQLLGAPSQRIMELELQLAEVREINSKLTAVEQELFKQISDKDDEHESLVRLIHNKDSKIQELQEIIELKEMNFSSHISSSQHKSKIRQSLHSQSSLRYSMLSNNPNKDKTMELQLSEAGESFFENNQSMISNVSEVFGRDQFPYQKMQLRRVEQRRLFEKTAAYIKTLKKAIDQKNKKIKVLEKKIQSLRNSELIRKDIYDIKEDFEATEQEDVFKDYLSVQLENTHSQRYRFKQLQHQAKLTIQQNNLLNNQIQNMQEELLKAEQQENSLMKLKDLYKDEIKSLIKKNQEQAKAFEEQVKKERLKVEQSESVQKMEALKQLFLKITGVFAVIEAQGHKSKKRQDRKKQLEDYVKVFCNLISIDAATRDKILSDMRK